MADSQFCPLCEVSLDLHDGPDTCEIAEAQARVIDLFWKMTVRNG